MQFMVLAVFKCTVHGHEVHASCCGASPPSTHGTVSSSHTVPTKPHSLPVPPNPAPGSQMATVLSNHEFDSFRASRPMVAVLLCLVYFTLHSVLEVSSVLYHASEFPPFSRLSNTPSCKLTQMPFCVCVLLLADAWVASPLLAAVNTVAVNLVVQVSACVSLSLL